MCARHLRLASELLLIPPLLQNHCILRNEKDLKQMAIKNRKFNYHKQERPGRKRTIVSCRNDSRLFRAVEWREQVADNTLNSDQGFWSLWKNSKTILGKIEDCTHTFYRIHSEGTLKLLINKRKALVVAGYKKLDRQRPYRSLPSLEVPSFLPGSSADRGDEEGEKQSNFLANNQVETRSFFGQKDEEEEGKTIRIFSMTMGLRQWNRIAKKKPDAQKQEEKKEAHETSAEHHERKQPGPNLQREKKKEKLPKENRTWRRRRRQCKLCKTPNSHKQQTNSGLFQSFYDIKTSIAAPPQKPHNNNPTAFHKSSFLETQTPAPTKRNKNQGEEQKDNKGLLPSIKLLQQQTTRSKNTNLSTTTTTKGNKTSPWQQYHNNKNRRKQF